MSIFKKKPTVMSLDDQKNIPSIPYGIKGMSTRPIINPWMHDSKLVAMGVCDHAPEMDDIPIQLAEGNCEIFYCPKGSLWLMWEDDEGSKGDLRCKEGEFMWLPGGQKYKYVLKATGEQSKNVWVTITGGEFSEEKLNAWFDKYKQTYPDFTKQMEELAKT